MCSVAFRYFNYLLLANWTINFIFNHSRSSSCLVPCVSPMQSTSIHKMIDLSEFFVTTVQTRQLISGMANTVNYKHPYLVLAVQESAPPHTHTHLQ